MLRERKKLETRRLLWETAIRLFTERGFDNVAMAEIAAASNVSKTTVFNYFGSKEDLVLGPAEEHVDEPARVVRTRAPGETPLAALRRHFLTALADRDASTGLSDKPNVLRVQRLVNATPALAPRLFVAMARAQDSLAEALTETLTESTDSRRTRVAETTAPRIARPAETTETTDPHAARPAETTETADPHVARLAETVDSRIARLAAAQIIGTRMVLVAENRDRMLAGEPADMVYPLAVLHANQAFDLLETGLAANF